MSFCEQCGARLSTGASFCEECGAAVEDNVLDAASKDVPAHTDELKEVFSTDSWEKEWANETAEIGGQELGLILTRESVLLEHLYADAAQLHGLISGYISTAVKRGVQYFYINIDRFPGYSGNGSVESVVSVLKRIVDVARPKYLFILGNEQVVDVARWNNVAHDQDGQVESDLCYATLDVMSPWSGQRYDFDETIRVGRLPTYSGKGFLKFKRYFDAASAHVGHMDEVVPYGLSALVWEKESNYEFGKTASQCVDVSPDVVSSTVGARIGAESNLLFFNLHGSNGTKYWYGQSGDKYPEAFSPAVLTGRLRPYFLGVEACYGARYLGGLTAEDSIVLTALENNCIAFLGSSRIAFGTPSPTGSCADLVIGSYIKGISVGESAGDAHVEGLKRLTADWNALDDSDIKTMAEFALYGDPSARKGANVNTKGIRNLFLNAGVGKGLRVPIPDVRRAVCDSIVEVDEKIGTLIDDYVRREVLPELASSIGTSDVKSVTVKMINTGLNQRIYTFRAGSFDRVAKVYFDDDGRVRKTLVSK